LRDKIDIIKNYYDKKWTLQFLDALYNSIDSIDYLIFLFNTRLVNGFEPNKLLNPITDSYDQNATSAHV
jgi:hypothetical protein